MDQRDIDKTMLVPCLGVFCFTKLSPGLCHAPATFVRLMELVGSGLNWKIYLIYLDDVTVYDALDRLKTVWQQSGSGPERHT